MAKNKKIKGVACKIEKLDFKPCKSGEFLVEYSEKTKRFSLKNGDKFVVSDISSAVVFGHADDLGVKRETFRNI